MGSEAKKGVFWVVMRAPQELFIASLADWTTGFKSDHRIKVNCKLSI